MKFLKIFISVLIIMIGLGVIIFSYSNSNSFFTAIFGGIIGGLIMVGGMKLYLFD